MFAWLVKNLFRGLPGRVILVLPDWHIAATPSRKPLSTSYRAHSELGRPDLMLNHTGLIRLSEILKTVELNSRAPRGCSTIMEFDGITFTQVTYSLGVSNHIPAPLSNQRRARIKVWRNVWVKELSVSRKQTTKFSSTCSRFEFCLDFQLSPELALMLHLRRYHAPNEHKDIVLLSPCQLLQRCSPRKGLVSLNCTMRELTDGQLRLNHCFRPVPADSMTEISVRVDNNSQGSGPYCGKDKDS